MNKELKNGNSIKIISNLWREDTFICLKVKLEVTKQKVFVHTYVLSYMKLSVLNNF